MRRNAEGNLKEVTKFPLHRAKQGSKQTDSGKIQEIMKIMSKSWLSEDYSHFFY